MNLKTRIASQSSIIFGMRLLGAGMIVLVQAAIARIWGGEILGEYLLFMAVVNLVAMAMPLGFQSVGIYFASEYRASGQGLLLWRFLVRAYAHIILVGFSLGLVGFVLASQFGAPLALVLKSWISLNFVHGIEHYWVPGSLLACAVAIVFVNGAVLVGLKRPYAGFFADGLFRPMLVIAAFALALVFANPDYKLGTMIWAFALGYWVVALVHFVIVVQSVKDMPSDASVQRKDVLRWWRFALPWVLIDLATLFFFDIDLILLSGLMDRHTLAVFGICTRMFSIMAFGIAAVYAVSLPDMFEAAAKEDQSEFYQKLGDANLVAAALSIALFCGVLLFGPLVLMIFGSSFMVGALPLAILCLALVVRSVFGPAALVLSIHDRPWASLPSIGAGMIVLGFGNVLFVPMWGLMGAALSALAAFSIWSALMWWTALKTTNMDVSILPKLRQIVRARVSKASETTL